jgi:23S rRNA (guanosine2251-2'-O)-methyltransferase
VNPRRGKSAPKGRPDPDVVLIWGYHPVREALRSSRRKLLRLSATAAAAEKLSPELAARDLSATLVSPEDLSARLPRDAVHQGVLLETRPLQPLSLDDLPDSGLLVILDQVTDPHNVGAILRTAAAFGAVGLVLTERHSPEMTGVLAKAASGGLEHVPVVHVVNLARTLEELGDRGFQRIGLDSDGAVPLSEVAIEPAVAVVLGAEGKGLRRLTRENCDLTARLDFPGPIKSLNVSNACVAALTMLHRRPA